MTGLNEGVSTTGTAGTGTDSAVATIASVLTSVIPVGPGKAFPAEANNCDALPITSRVAEYPVLAAS